MLDFDENVDVEIKDLLVRLNEIPGVSTWSSCQGIRKGNNLSKEHSRKAFIMFTTLPVKYVRRLTKSRKVAIFKRMWSNYNYRLKKSRNEVFDYVVESRFSKYNHLFRGEMERIFMPSYHPLNRD